MLASIFDVGSSLLRITPFIVTLGTMSLLRGAAKGLADEQKIDADPRGLDELMAVLASERSWLLLPPGVWITIAVALLAAGFLRYAQLGRQVVAIGSNVATARLCGIAVGRVTLLVYTLAGALAGLAGVMEFSTLTVGDQAFDFTRTLYDFSSGVGVDTGRPFQLLEAAREKPVALVFGSYT